MMFLRCCVALSSACFSGGSDLAVGVEATEGAVAFLKNAVAFFKERFDLIDEFFFVEFFFRGTVGLLDVLEYISIRSYRAWKSYDIPL
jgi:hypothetical protein